MARVKIKLADNIARIVFVETNATIGSTLGVDFKLPDGSIATVASLATLLGIGGDNAGITDHRLLAGLTVGDDHPQYTRKDTLTTRGDLYVRGASTVQRFAIGSANQVLRTDGTDPVWHTFSPVITLGTDLSGSATLTDLGSATLNSTIVANAVTDSKLRQSAGLSVIGRSANTTGNVADISATTDGDVLRRSGTSIGFGNIGANPSVSIGLTAKNGTANTYLRSDAAPALDVSITPTWTATHTFNNTPVVPNASWTYAKIQNVSATSRILGRITAGAGDIEELTGTQATTLLGIFTSGLQGVVPASGGGTSNFLRADGTFAVPAGTGVTSVTGTANRITSSGGTTPVIDISASYVGQSSITTLGTITTCTWTGTAIAEVNGGTNQTSYTTGDILYASASNTLSKLAGVATGNAFISGGVSTAPSWGKIGLTTHISGILGPANGGTGSANGNVIGLGGNLLTAAAFTTAGAFGLTLTTTGTTNVTLPTSGTLATTAQLPVGANPSASLGLTAVNGSATTYMRSDAAPALDVSISPTWTGNHTFSPTSGVPLTVNATSIAAGTASASFTGHSTIPLVLGDLSAAPSNVLSCYVAISTSALTGINGDLVLIPRSSTTASVRLYSTIGGGASAERIRVDGTTGCTVASSAIVLANYTVSGLPSAATVGAGATAFVTDATLGIAAGLGLTPIGGGANNVPVYSDGSAWKIG